MDADPELDTTLTDGRQVARYAVQPLATERDMWAISAPDAGVQVVVGTDAALAARAQLDASWRGSLPPAGCPTRAGTRAGRAAVTRSRPPDRPALGIVLSAVYLVMGVSGLELLRELRHRSGSGC